MSERVEERGRATVIRGATIVDGMGAPAYLGDVGIRDGRIDFVVAAPFLARSVRRCS